MLMWQRGLESDGRGVPTMLALMRGEGTSHIPFAPPFLRDGDVIVSHTAAILLYLGGRIGLARTDEDGRLWTHQVQLTITDIVKEVYNSHHPIDEDMWFYEQKDQAIARAAVFRRDRMPKFLGWLERILEANPAGADHLVGSSVTYADLSLFQLIDGLQFAFPLASERELAKLPRVTDLHRAVTTAALEGLSGKRSACSIQRNGDLPPLFGAGWLARKAVAQI